MLILLSLPTKFGVVRVRRRPHAHDIPTQPPQLLPQAVDKLAERRLVLMAVELETQFAAARLLNDFHPFGVALVGVLDGLVA
jgi:hypothetical protein